MAGTLVLALSALLPLTVSEAQGQGQGSRPARQVTVFGIVAVPGINTIDPKLKEVAPQLRKLLPGHGFKLLDVKSKRLTAGQAVICDLGGGASALTTLIQPLDEDGKVQLRCELVLNGVPQHATIVATPPNQLFFCDKTRDDGSRILIGIGAR